MKRMVTTSRRHQFERVVFVVDVKVLLEQEDRRSCAVHIFNSVVTCLEKCNEHNRSSTLWGYVFFDSSRSPMASNATVGRLVTGNHARERFDGVTQNLEKFGKVLEAVVASGDGYTSAGKSRADCIARTLSAVASDFQWDPLIASDSSSSDEDARTNCHHETHSDVDLQSTKHEANLVFLFSSLPTCSIQLASFLDFQAGLADQSALEEKLLLEFASRFRSAKSLLDTNHISCCWIDVRAKENFSNSVLFEDYVTEQSVAQRCLSAIAWNSVSLRLIANITGVVPLSLIWNKVAYITPALLDRGAAVRCHARVRIGTSGLRGNCGDPTTSLSVGVQPCSMSVFTSCSSGYVSRPSRFFRKENLVTYELEIVILSKLWRRNRAQLSAERYLVLQKPPEDFRLHTDTEKILSADPRSVETKVGEPSWPGLLVSLESEGSMALVTVGDGECNCQAILEPFTHSIALLTVLDNAGSPLSRKHVPTRSKCHLSGVFKRCLTEKLEEYAKGRGRVLNTGDDRKVGKADVGIGDVSEFEKSFDSTLLKVVKEKRRGCVLFKSVKKHRTEWGKTLEPTHDLFQGSSSEPERVSWQEYWRRAVKRLQRDLVVSEKNCTLSSSLGIITYPVDLSSLEQFAPKAERIHSTGTSVGLLDHQSDLHVVGMGSESASRSAIGDTPWKVCVSVPSTPPTLGGESLFSPTARDGDSGLSFSTSAHTFGPRSSAPADGMGTGREVILTPTLELRPFHTPVLEKKATKRNRTGAIALGVPSRTVMDENSRSPTSLGDTIIEQLAREVLTSKGVDLHQFAESVVSEAYRKVRPLKDRGVVEEGMLASEAASCKTSSASIRVKKLLLTRPKHLLSKYKELLASEATTTRSKACIVAEKLKEHELQILFRLEILALESKFHGSGRQECFVRDICQLLDNIQFHLVGGDGSEESLRQYCERVIVSRYKALLPSVIEKVFSAMELNGYCDPSSGSSVYIQGVQTPETQPSSEDAVSRSEHEPTETSSDAQDSPGQEKCFLPNRSRLSSEVDCKPKYGDEVITSYSRNRSGKENAPNIPHMPEKKREVYHFSSGAHNLLRVKAVKPRDHIAVKFRKNMSMSCTSTTGTSDRNTKMLVTSTPVHVKQEHVLQSRGQDVHVVCQTPAFKLRPL